MPYACFSLSTLALLLLPFPSYAGAWLQRDNHGLFTQQLSYYSAREYFNQNSKKTPQATFNKLEYQPYVELGLTRRYTIGATALVQRNWQGGATNSGIADPEIFLRARLYHDKRQVISLQPLVKLPSYFTHENSTPRGGTETTDAELSLLYGRNLTIISGDDFIDTRIGYRARGRGLNNQTRADLLIGLNPHPQWRITPGLHYIKAARLVGDVPFRESGEQDFDLLKGAFSVNYQMDRRQSLYVSYLHDLYGKQTGAGQMVALGYGIQF